MSVGSRLARLVAREAPRAATFAALTEVCEGAWPGEVRRVLVEDDGREAHRLLAGIARPSERVTSDPRLPLAHPLDADWRFTRRCADDVLDALLAATPSDADILLVAMPTVALAAYDRGVAHRVVVASRADDPIDTALRAAMLGGRFTPLTGLTAGAFQTVALDPPWYDDVALPLIALAVDAATAEGHVFVCAPDGLTLPSCAQRLSALEDDPRALGFEAAAFVGRVRYATPFFELRCLAAIGIADVSPRWRTGRLYACTPGRRTAPGWPVPPAAGGVWHEVRHGPVRIWTRPVPGCGGTGVVAVARSISRTDHARATAALWTSGNTYAADIGTIAPDVLSSALAGAVDAPWQRRLRAALSDERAAVERAVDFSERGGGASTVDGHCV